MKNLTRFLAFSLLIGPFLLYSQDRPKDIGVSDFDNFKNSSFDIQEESASLKSNVTKLDDEIKSYKSVINTIGVKKIKGNLAALKESKQAVKTLNDRIGVLDDQGKTMVDNAKNVKPKMKSISATKNTNQSVKSLGVAKDDLKAVTAILDEDVKLLTDELKSRGEDQ